MQKIIPFTNKHRWIKVCEPPSRNTKSMESNERFSPPWWVGHACDLSLRSSLSWLLWLSFIFVYVILCLLSIDLSIFVLPIIFGRACAEQTASHAPCQCHILWWNNSKHTMCICICCAGRMRTPDATQKGLCWRAQPNELKEISKGGCMRKSGNLVVH